MPDFKKWIERAENFEKFLAVVARILKKYWWLLLLGLFGYLMYDSWGEEDVVAEEMYYEDELEYEYDIDEYGDTIYYYEEY